MKSTLIFLAIIMFGCGNSNTGEVSENNHGAQTAETIAVEDTMATSPVKIDHAEVDTLKTITPKTHVPKSAVKSAVDKPKTVASVQEIQEGKALLSKSDCLACHKLEEKVVGPAYSDVAKKYALTDANVGILAQKVINGGSGVWGQVPMSPHPALSVTDAEKMIKYVLSLNDSNNDLH